jgi:hypothetical protein
MKTLKNIKADPNTVKAQILADADGDITYIEDAATHGCIGGNCRKLIYYSDTHAFYAKYAENIDEILQRIEDEQGEPYDITGSMKRLNQTDLRNFLAWMAYEVEAQAIMREFDPDKF